MPFWLRISMLVSMAALLVTDVIYRIFPIEKIVYGVLLVIIVMIGHSCIVHIEQREKESKEPKQRNLFG